MRKLLLLSLFILITNVSLGLEIWGIETVIGMHSVGVDWQTSATVRGKIEVDSSVFLEDELTSATSHSLFVDGLEEDTNYVLLITDTGTTPSSLEYGIKTFSYLNVPLTGEQKIINEVVGLGPGKYFKEIEVQIDLSALVDAEKSAIKYSLKTLYLYCANDKDIEELFVRELTRAITDDLFFSDDLNPVPLSKGKRRALFTALLNIARDELMSRTINELNEKDDYIVWLTEQDKVPDVR